MRKWYPPLRLIISSPNNLQSFGYPITRDSIATKFQTVAIDRNKEKKKEGKNRKERLINTWKGVASKNIIYYCVPRTHRNGFPNADNVRKIIRMLLV